jgi:hypothetical protein
MGLNFVYRSWYCSVDTSDLLIDLAHREFSCFADALYVLSRNPLAGRQVKRHLHRSPNDLYFFQLHANAQKLVTVIYELKRSPMPLTGRPLRVGAGSVIGHHPPFVFLVVVRAVRIV